MTEDKHNVESSCSTPDLSLPVCEGNKLAAEIQHPTEKCKDKTPRGLDRPLSIQLIKGELVIRVGFNVIKLAAENMDANNQWDGELNDFKRLWSISDVNEFANDVRHALLDEEEDGSTPLTNLFDKACLDAIEGGSQWVEDSSEASS